MCVYYSYHEHDNYNKSSLIALHLLGSLVIVLLGLLDLLSHGFLLNFVLFYQLVSILDLAEDHPQSVRQSGLHFFLFLIDEHSTYLLIYFHVFWQDLNFFQDKTVLLLLF